MGAGKWGSEPVIWPAQAHDVKAAIRWLRANADMLKVDPRWFISFGNSAGGHLTSILATTEGVEYLKGTVGNYTSVPSRVALAVDWFGPSSFLHLDDDKAAVGPPQFPKDMQHEGVDAPESQLFGSDNTNQPDTDYRTLPFDNGTMGIAYTVRQLGIACVVRCC